MSSTSRTKRASDTHLSTDLPHGQLGRGALVLFALAAYIPAIGIAIIPVAMLPYAGYGSWLSTAVAALATSCIGVGVSIFARRYVAGGSLYSYVGEVLGPVARYIVGGSLFVGFIIFMASTTFLAGLFFGSALTSFGVEAGLDKRMLVLIYVVLIGLTAAIVYRGLDTSVKAAVVLAAISIPLVLLCAGASVASTGFEFDRQFDFANASWSGILLGVAVGSAFLYGFESSSSLALETKDPKKNVPWAIMCVPIGLGALYVVTTLVSVPGLMQGSDLLKQGVSGPAVLASVGGLPTWIGSASDIVLCIAAFAALIGFANYGARLFATLAKDGLLPRVFARVNSRHQTPFAAVTLLLSAALGLLVIVLALASVIDLLTLWGLAIAFTWSIPYLIFSAAVLTLLYREGRLKVKFIIPTVIGAATIILVVVSNLITPFPWPLNTVVYIVLAVIVIVSLVFATRNRKRVK